MIVFKYLILHPLTFCNIQAVHAVHSDFVENAKHFETAHAGQRRSSQANKVGVL
jgi:hypothetical protein